MDARQVQLIPGERPVRVEQLRAHGRARFLLSLALASGMLVAPAQTRAASAPETLLNFCVANPGICAISVFSIDEGWERHLNPDRPQALASTMKTVMLIAYAQAVVDGFLSPDDTMSRDEWARYLTLDGGALNAAWAELGTPLSVSWRDLVRMMILHSDNSTPDHLIANLGSKRIRKALKVVRGFHDTPAPISAMFGLWFNGNGVGGTGGRIASDYGGFAVADYTREVDTLFSDLSTPAGVATNRSSLCVAPAWETVNCDRATPLPNAAEVNTLLRNHFTRSTTRTYAELMKGILDGTRLPAAVEAVTRPALEVWLQSFPSLQTAFSRYAVKGGSLAGASGIDILTWSTYIENASDGRRFAVAVFLQGLTEVNNAPGGLEVQEFAQQFALSPTFRNRVRDALAEDDSRDELVPQIKKVRRSGGARQSRAVKLTVKARVNNAGPGKSAATKVALYLSSDGELDGSDTLLKTVSLPPLKGFKGKNVTLRATLGSDPTGKFILLVADSENDTPEQDEGNNVLRQRVPER